MNLWEQRTSSRTVAIGLALAPILMAAPASAASTKKPSTPWWAGSVIYEIYPRSFQDSDGNGTGDLNGVTSRLNYLKKLGVGAIWLTPFYPSPQVDFGYDISNYTAIDPLYGTMMDFDRLVASAKRQKIRVIIDMVLNHTSDEHPWFVQSEASRSSSMGDWYVWSNGRRGADGKLLPPNNWQSNFGGSAWQWNSSRRQFYYHRYYRQQPDLNWRNPKVRAAMKGVAKFWLGHGVSGFRMDSITDLLEDRKLGDNRYLGRLNLLDEPVLDDSRTFNLPAVHSIIRDYRAYVTRIDPNAVLLGETWFTNTNELDSWYGGVRRDELQLPMDFLVGMGDIIDHKPSGSDKLDIPLITRRLRQAYAELHGEPVFVTDSHDLPRSWDRYGDGVHDLAIAKALATVLLTVKGSVVLFQGQEIGQITAPPRRLEDVRDPIGRAGWPKEKGRDGERTPMQWTGAVNAGFTSPKVKPWLPVTPNSKTVNVDGELRDPGSLLNWYRALLALRGKQSAFRNGAIQILNTHCSVVLAFLRSSAIGSTFLVIVNGSIRPQQILLSLPKGTARGAQLEPVLSSVGVPMALRADRKMNIPPLAAMVVPVSRWNDANALQQGGAAPQR